MSSSYKKYNQLGNDAGAERQRPTQQQPMQMQQQPMQMQQRPMQMQQQPMQMQQQPMQMQQQGKNTSQNGEGGDRRLVPVPPNPRLAKACHKCVDIPQKKKMIWNNEICIFKIGAPWCAPCRDIAPRYHALAYSLSSPGKMLFAEEELEDNLSANVRGVPCFDFYFRGKKVHRQNGGNFKELQRNVRGLLAQAKNSESADLSNVMSRPPHPADGMQPRNRVKVPQRGEIPSTAIRKFV